MQSSETHGNKPIKVVEKQRARTACPEHVSRDAAENRRTQEAKDQLYQSVMENAYVAVTLIDRNYKILIVNKAAGEWVGKSAGEHVGRECFREFEKRQSVCPYCPGKQAMETGRPAQAQREGVRDDGSRFPVRIQTFPTTDRDGHITGFIEIIEDITERKRAEETLEYRAKLERVITEVSTGFINLPSEEIDTSINRALQILGDFARVDRSYIFQFCQNDDMMSNTYEWCARGIESQMHRLKEVPVDFLSWITERILRFETVHVPRVADLPPEASRIKDECRVQGIKSFIGVPLVSGGRCIGALGFDSVREEKEWSEDIITLLNLAAHAIANALQRKQSEKALQESEERFRLAFENANIGTCLVDLDGRLIRVNSQMCEIFGYNQQELESMTVNDIAHPEDLDTSPRFIQRAASGEIEHTQFEKRYFHKQGHIVWGQVSSSLVRDFQGAPLYFISHVQNITERKKVEEKLRESEERYRALIESQIDLISRYRPDTILTFANDAYCQFYGKARDELIGHSFLSMVAPELHELVLKQTENMVKDPRPIAGEYLNYRQDGEECWIQWVVRGIVDESGRVVELQAVGRDITERKKAEDELREYQSKLKAMASQLSSVQERERRQLAVELHDRITQRLAMVKLGLETSAISFTDADAAGKVKGIAEQVGRTMEDAYSLMLEMSNPVLYEIGLKAAVDVLLQSDLVKRCGIKCRLVAPREPMKIDTDIRVPLYQAIRELLVNAIKHSRAKEVEVHLRRTRDTATVTVRDDGIGFDPSDVKPPGNDGGFGLFNIRENIGGIGGEFTIESKPGEGMSATACVPLPRKGPPTQKGGECENSDRR